MFKVTLHDARTLQWWNSHRDEIDLSPLYQREGDLWSPSDKAYLIDTILNDFDIPKIYLADFTYYNSSLNRKKKPYAVIDGRQRLESIYDFFADRITLNDDFVFEPDHSLKLGGLTYSDLKSNHPKIASKFEEYNLHVMSVITDDEARINELFVRLNRSKPLTGAELRNAMSGVVPKVIRRLAEHDVFRSYVRFPKKRGQDKNTAAKLLLIEFRGKFVDTKRFHLDRFVQEGLASETSDVSSAGERAEAVLGDMTHVFRPKDPLLASQGPVPVYYWLVRTYGPQANLREFLVNFERTRQENSNKTKKGDKESIDQELLTYDVLSRNTNDQGSLLGRYRILERRYLSSSAQIPMDKLLSA